MKKNESRNYTKALNKKKKIGTSRSVIAYDKVFKLRPVFGQSEERMKRS